LVTGARRRASRSGSADFASTGASIAFSICSSKAAATAAATRLKPKATKQAPISASVTSGSGREPASRVFAGIDSSASGWAASSIAGTPSSRPTTAQERPLTAWLWILVRPPAPSSGKRS